MRPGPEFATFSHVASAPTAAPGHGLINGTAVAHSPWQSPVPYLFGGLAAMLGLIAFALLILVCSYWKLSGFLDAGAEGGRDGQAGDAAGGEKGSASGSARPAAEFLEHVVVIMAGDERPTFLAKPATSRAAVEVELALGAPAASHSAGVDQEKKVDECEVSSTQLGADESAGAASQNHRDHDDAASQSLENDAASRSLENDAANQNRGHHHHDHDDESSSSSSSTTALQESSQ